MRITFFPPVSIENWKRICINVFVTFLIIPCYGRSYINVDERDILTEPNSLYIIRSRIDLRGRTLNAPEGCVVVFKDDGKVVNGTIIGNHTRLKYIKDGSIGIVMKGSWIAPTIYDSYFDHDFLTDNQILDNITSLQSDDIKNIIFLRKPSYSIILSDGHRNGLTLSSNTTLNNQSELNVVGNDLPVYMVINVSNKHNVFIKGGKIVGDVGSHRYVDGSTSEWGFGIGLFTSNNIKVENLAVCKCTGDGLYIGGGTGNDLEDNSKACKDVRLKNIVCDDNRRQGISITYADGVVIENCTFSNTGKTEFTSPGCGLDIEPNAGQSVRNIRIKKCQFLHNDRIMDVSIGGYKQQGNKCNVENIVFNDCEITGEMSVRSGSVTLVRCSMASLSLHLAKMPKDGVLLNGCKIIGGSGVMVRTVLDMSDKEYSPTYTFKKCTISMNKAATGGLFSTIRHQGNEIAEFHVKDCSIVLPEGDKAFFVVQPNTKMNFTFSKCRINPRGRSIDISGRSFSNCRIIDK